MSEALAAEVPERIVHEMTPSIKQWLFLLSRTRHTAYGGARGGGKSWVADLKIVLLCNKFAGIKVCLVRRTRKDLIDNHLEPLKRLIGNKAKYNSNDAEFRFVNGSTIHLRYCDNRNDADHFQGIEYDIIVIEEATQLEEDWIKDIAASCRGVNDFPHRIYYTCNPGGPGHAYIKRVFVDRIYKPDEDPNDYTFIQAKVTDNDVLMKYDPNYVKFLKNLPPKRRAAWLDGSWEIYEGMYFQLVNDPDHYQDRLFTHVIDPIPIRPHWTIYRGFDWGSYRPFSVGWYAITEDSVMIRFRELYGVQKSGQESLPNEGVGWNDSKIFRKIYEIEHTDPRLVNKDIIGIADPAIFRKEGSGISTADTAMQCGVYFQKADNDRIRGWMQCQERLKFDEFGVPRFYVTTDCPEFIRTIPTLMHDPHDVEDVWSDGEDHIADEWRYVAMRNLISGVEEPPKPQIAYGADPLNQYGRGQ